MPPPGTQVVVVANDPSDAQAAALRPRRRTWRRSAASAPEVLRTSTRLGYAAALNIGLRRATGEIVLAGRRLGLADRRRARPRSPPRLAIRRSPPSVALASGSAGGPISAQCSLERPDGPSSRPPTSRPWRPAGWPSAAPTTASSARSTSTSSRRPGWTCGGRCACASGPSRNGWRRPASGRRSGDRGRRQRDGSRRVADRPPPRPRPPSRVRQHRSRAAAARRAVRLELPLGSGRGPVAARSVAPEPPEHVPRPGPIRLARRPGLSRF